MLGLRRGTGVPLLCLKPEKSDFENKYSQDRGLLKNVIIRTKPRVEKRDHNGHHDGCAVPMGPGVCPVAKGSCDWTGCRFRDVPAPSGGIVKLKSKESLSRRASQQQIQNERFAEIIEGWKRQNENLDRELTAYRAQKSDSKQRLKEKNSEINLLRRQNEKLESLLRKCEIQIRCDCLIIF